MLLSWTLKQVICFPKIQHLVKRRIFHDIKYSNWLLANKRQTSDKFLCNILNYFDDDDDDNDDDGDYFHQFTMCLSLLKYAYKIINIYCRVFTC